MSAKKKVKKKNKFKKSHSSKLTETENTENTEKEESVIEIIENSHDDEKYEELEDESISETSSNSDIIENNNCIFENTNDFYQNNITNLMKNITIKDEDRITRPILTKYEYVRILTDRVKQLTLGAKPMIKNSKQYTHKEIAKMEIEMKVCPFKIERPLPNGQKEIFKLSELTIKQY
jgi:DNA-directed RNA polymerase subunit K/omega